jgi:hypothetical protein
MPTPLSKKDSGSLNIARNEKNLSSICKVFSRDHALQWMTQTAPVENPVKTSIQPLKKVSLSLMAGNKPDTFALTRSPAVLEFIYGVASDGLCPFESALNDRQEGDILTINIPRADASEFFGHIFQPLCESLGLQIMPEILFLKIEVTAVTDADNREVVRSLAKALVHGNCGGSCGCGC